MHSRKVMLRLALLAAIAAIFVEYSQELALMSVDLGGEWMKVAIVKPGVPMEIVLNPESKRKTPMVVSMKDGERLFAEAALIVSVRSPKSAYIYTLDILGKKFDNPVVKIFKKRFPFYDLVEDEATGTVLFRHDSDTLYSPEEIIAMLLQYARRMTEDYGGQPVTNAVITVPSYFNQAERRAMLRAANISGLNVLQLMNDNAAVGLNFGMFRRSSFKEKEQIYLFYDMGASSTTATVASYKTVGKKETGLSEILPQVQIKGVGFDRTLGGLEIDFRLREHLLKLVKEQGKIKDDITKSPRAMAKLLKEARRLKIVLSANSDHMARIENLYDGIDFQGKVTREELEVLCDDIFKRVAEPINRALKAANVIMDEIEKVILVGGATRVPKVQKELLTAVKRQELGKSLNTDEAAAMGAVYQAASLGKGFRVMKFLVRDGNMYPIQVSYNRSSGTTESGTLKRVRLFPHNNRIPQRKVMTISKLSSDFSVAADYFISRDMTKDQVRLHGSSQIVHYDLTGISDVFSKHDGVAESKGIKTHFRLDEHGLLRLDSVEAIFEKKPSEDENNEPSTLSKIGSNILNFFTKTDDNKIETEDIKDSKEEDTPKEEDTSKDKKQEKEIPEEEKADGKEAKKGKKEDDKKEKPTEDINSNTTHTSNDTASNSNATTKELPKVITIKEPIAITVTELDIKSPTEEALKASIDKLKELDRRDKERKEREMAKNALESYVVDTQDKLYTEEFEMASTEDERNSLKQSLSETSDWLYEDGFDVETSTYNDRLQGLREKLRDVFLRVKERRLRPAAFEELKKELNLTAQLIEIMGNLTSDNSSDDKPFTTSDVKEFVELCNETKDWMESSKKKQEQLSPIDNPIILTKDIKQKSSKIKRETTYLVSKLKRHSDRIKAKEAEEKAAREAAAKAVREAAAKAAQEAAKKKDSSNATSAETSDNESVEDQTKRKSDSNKQNGKGVEGDGQTLKSDTELPDDRKEKDMNTIKMKDQNSKVDKATKSESKVEDVKKAGDPKDKTDTSDTTKETKTGSEHAEL